MNTVTSKDGTTIAYDKLGQGPVVILVAGAFSFRKYSGSVELAELLAKDFTVINYDRRGRGDSGDTKPYAIEREIEDLDALIHQAGGSAYVWGLSSGAVLALKAAARGLNITKLAIHEPPFIVDKYSPQPPADFIPQISALAAADRRSDAVKYFMTKGMGAPAFAITMMRFMPGGVWKRLSAVANTLPYDAMLLQGHTSEQPLLTSDWANVTMPTLVMTGSKSPASRHKTAQELVKVLPNARLRTLEGLSPTNIVMPVIAPALKEFFAG